MSNLFIYFFFLSVLLVLRGTGHQRYWRHNNTWPTGLGSSMLWPNNADLPGSWVFRTTWATQQYSWQCLGGPAFKLRTGACKACIPDRRALTLAWPHRCLCCISYVKDLVLLPVHLLKWFCLQFIVKNKNQTRLLN